MDSTANDLDASLNQQKKAIMVGMKVVVKN